MSFTYHVYRLINMLSSSLERAYLGRCLRCYIRYGFNAFERTGLVLVLKLHTFRIELLLHTF